MKKDDLRILFISPLPPPAGGIATWTTKMIEWGKINGMNFEVVNTAVIGKRAIKINSNRKLFDEITRTIKILKSLMVKINEYHPDVVHLNTACGRFGIVRDYFCAMLIKFKRIPLVVHYRCNIEDQIKRKTQQHFLIKITNIADRNLVLNSSSKEYLDKGSSSKSIIIPNFIDEAHIAKKTKNISREIRNVIYVGHVQKTKGMNEIFETAKLFPKIMFTLTGPVSYEASSMLIPDNVHLIGEIEHEKVHDLLERSDVFLFPTYTEGFSNALLEAMAMGLPTIATPVGANVDMLENKGGIIVKIKDIKGIEKAIKVLNSNIVREEMSSWNVNKVKKCYLIDNVVLRLLSVYKEITINEE